MRTAADTCPTAPSTISGACTTRPVPRAADLQRLGGGKAGAAALMLDMRTTGGRGRGTSVDMAIGTGSTLHAGVGRRGRRRRRRAAAAAAQRRWPLVARRGKRECQAGVALFCPSLPVFHPHTVGFSAGPLFCAACCADQCHDCATQKGEGLEPYAIGRSLDQLRTSRRDEFRNGLLTRPKARETRNTQGRPARVGVLGARRRSASVAHVLPRADAHGRTVAPPDLARPGPPRPVCGAATGASTFTLTALVQQRPWGDGGAGLAEAPGGGGRRASHRPFPLQHWR